MNHFLSNLTFQGHPRSKVVAQNEGPYMISNTSVIQVKSVIMVAPTKWATIEWSALSVSLSVCLFVCLPRFSKRFSWRSLILCRVVGNGSGMSTVEVKVNGCIGFQLKI